MKQTLRQQCGFTVKTTDAGFDTACEAMGNEIATVLQQLDHLAEVWGYEGVFRRCHDRLRELIPDDDDNEETP